MYCQFDQFERSSDTVGQLGFPHFVAMIDKHQAVDLFLQDET